MIGVASPSLRCILGVGDQADTVVAYFKTEQVLVELEQVNL